MAEIKYIGKCLLITADANEQSGEKHGERVLVVGDLHLGYEGALRERGWQVPLGLYKQVVSDFNAIYGKVILGQSIKIDKIIILGDVKHEFGWILPEEWDEIINFIEYLKTKCGEIVIIEGNHDKILFPILRRMNVVAEDYYLWNGFAFMHGDKEFIEIYDKRVKYWIVGHGHPAINIDDGTKQERYKCFLVGTYSKIGCGKRRVIIVPSFFPLIAGTDARDFDMCFAWDFKLSEFGVFVVNDSGEVLGFGKLKDV